MDERALVAPGLPVVEVTDISPLHLTVQVDEIDVRQIREGMPAQIKLDALPGVLLLATLEHIGVIGSSGFTGDENDLVIVPLTTAQTRLSGQRVLSGERPISSILAQARDGGSVDAAAAEIR